MINNAVVPLKASRSLTPEEKKKKFLYAFAALLLIISLFAVFGEKGLIDVYRLKKEKDSIVTYNKSLEAENKELAKRVELLKTDKDYIASVARKELGMTSDKEIIYKIDEENKAESVKE